MNEQGNWNNNKKKKKKKNEVEQHLQAPPSSEHEGDFMASPWFTTTSIESTYESLKTSICNGCNSTVMNRPSDTKRGVASSSSSSKKQQHTTSKTKALVTKINLLVVGAAGAGKTSILRRYFYDSFDKEDRVSTLGSDFYTKKVPSIPCHATTTTTTTVRLQMWDTPGRERFYLHPQQHSKRKKETRFTASSLSDNFFRQVDAVLLVYDMTSSTSFTQLLRWYADLMEIRDNFNFLIFIVGNKWDLFLADQQRATKFVNPRRVAQRNVMGIPKNFRGHDFRYEYKVSIVTQQQQQHTHSLSRTSFPKNKSRTLKHNNNNHNTAENYSSFFANHRENWTKDYSYLDSLLNSEDASRPDRDMALLWCKRNALEHFEVSAATGEGIAQAISSILQITVNSQNINNKPQVPPNPANQPQIDLFERYKVKDDENCCFGLFKSWYCPILEWCPTNPTMAEDHPNHCAF